MTPITIPTTRQGQTGMGQGGWASFEFVRTIGEPVTVALCSPIPLETELHIREASGERWELFDPDTPSTTILAASRWDRSFAGTTAISIEQAEEARTAFPLAESDHPAPHCLSCGIGERSLRVHAGPLGDGRWATPWRAPEWSLTDGAVDEGLLWMGMDCACGWYTAHDGPNDRRGVTVQLAVEIHRQLRPETDYALIAWHGDYSPGWDGRKRGAAAALFDQYGDCIAQSRSFWISTF